MQFSLSSLLLPTVLFLSTFVVGKPQGVYDLIAPPEPIPAGCVKSFPQRFAFTAVPIHKGLPSSVHPSMPTLCDAPNVLSVMLRNGVLTDRQGRIGAIVSNRQFQFDGPPAQAGSIYTAGFSLCLKDQILALGSQKVFFRCASGDFYNLYDRSLGIHCEKVYFATQLIGQPC